MANCATRVGVAGDTPQKSAASREASSPLRVALVGLGGGTVGTLTCDAARILETADLVVGAQRLLDGLAACDGALPSACVRVAETRPDAIVRLLRAAREDGHSRHAVVALSGDAGFYSGARNIVSQLESDGFAHVEVVAGISSVQLLAARLHRPWQDWGLCSAHGVDADPVGAVCHGRPAFFLTGGADGPARICRALAEAGLGALRTTVGENLSYPDERLETGAASEFAERTFAPLNCMLVEAAPRRAPRAPGIADKEFVRGEVPMTKQEVRAVALAKLAVGAGDVCWDVGAGTGSVSVELALQARSVWAVERSAEACELVRKNRERFCAWNLCLVEGEAPAALAGLPTPDAVFVGGSGSRLDQILDCVAVANPAARVCVAAIALETLSRACDGLAARGWDVEVAQVAVNRTKLVAGLRLLMASNPVFLVTGVRPDAGSALGVDEGGAR